MLVVFLISVLPISVLPIFHNKMAAENKDYISQHPPQRGLAV